MNKVFLITFLFLLVIIPINTAFPKDYKNMTDEEFLSITLDEMKKMSKGEIYELRKEIKRRRKKDEKKVKKTIKRMKKTIEEYERKKNKLQEKIKKIKEIIFLIRKADKENKKKYLSKAKKMLDDIEKDVSKYFYFNELAEIEYTKILIDVKSSNYNDYEKRFEKVVKLFDEAKTHIKDLQSITSSKHEIILIKEIDQKIEKWKDELDSIVEDKKKKETKK
ncbi:MAG: hypothetical protein KAI43_14160 [Candidatus Aureabacteria bacterium]|nr:hypothetical protein [Candidatus Auribacterota bacterium]